MTLLQAFASVSGMTFLSRLFGLARDVTLAAVFGATVSAVCFFCRLSPAQHPSPLYRRRRAHASFCAGIRTGAKGKATGKRQKLAGETAAGLGLLLLFISVLCVIAAPGLSPSSPPACPTNRWHPIYCVLSFPTSYSFHWWRWPPVC